MSNYSKVGIYLITNKINGKKYIGQSSNIFRRWKDHRINASNLKSNEYNSLLHKAFRKYGLDNFGFEIIEECGINELDDREIYWIDFYDSTNSECGYNISFGGAGFRNWFEKDISILTQLVHDGYTTEEICTIIGRSRDSVLHKKIELGIAMDKSWSKEDLCKLKSLFHAGVTVKEISDILRRTQNAVRRKLNLMGLFYKTRWSKDDEQKLLDYVAEGKSNKEISLLLNRNYSAVKSKRYELTKIG